MNDHNSVKLFGSSQSCTAWIFFGFVLIPDADTIWPKYSTSFLHNWHFQGLSLSHVSCRLHNTLSRLVSIASNDSPWTMIASSYIKHICQFRPANMVSMIRSNVAGGLQSPKGMVLNSKRLRCEVNAVFSLSTSSTSTQQAVLMSHLFLE